MVLSVISLLCSERARRIVARRLNQLTAWFNQPTLDGNVRLHIVEYESKQSVLSRLASTHLASILQCNYRSASWW